MKSKAGVLSKQTMELAMTKHRHNGKSEDGECVGTCEACGCLISAGEGVRIKDALSEWCGSLLCNECKEDLVDNEPI
jgi:hypothetical protein